MEIDNSTNIDRVRQLIDPSDHIALTPSVVSQLVFGTQCFRENPQHPILTALKSGLHCMLDNETSLVNSFGGSTELIILALLEPDYHNLDDESANQDGSTSGLNYPALAQSWMDQFSRYLQGAGHPVNDPSNHTPGQELVAHDLLFRSRLILKSVCALEYMPLNCSDRIRVNFQKSSPVGWTSDSVGLEIHTCFKSIDVHLCQQTATIIGQDVPNDTSVSTPFDRWIHSAFNMQADTYTAS
ncbi:hypothetical protein BV22DRAFT_1135114 [Leucogyrophana mollusca]|uniref:Uncharacterized protein n=1 Tax=Leucogyrophana mollusca TaxID=85980 RepID=A0ACB8AX25_9AGAM|nr:hypothetical protein BV22DRAFT_1135114 [Leucogyrophana mollusca]